MLLAALADFCIYTAASVASPQHPLTTPTNPLNSLNEDTVRRDGSSSSSNSDGVEITSSTNDNDNDSSRSNNNHNHPSHPPSENSGGYPHFDIFTQSTHSLHPLVQQSQCGLEQLRQAILRRDPLGTG